MSHPKSNKNQHPFLDTKIYNINRTHPLIESAQEYIFIKKYVSIHSEDRNILKYPNASDFEIELPEDLLNIAALRLYDWSFPSNYYSFSREFNNVTMTFKIVNPYNPNINSYSDLLAQKVFECLFYSANEDYTITIENGFYNPQQMALELTNKFNEAVTNRIREYLIQLNDPTLLQEFDDNDGYTNFIIVYNMVSLNLWFGNNSDGFVLTTETQFLENTLSNNIQCPPPSTIDIPYPPYKVPEYNTWGLPGYLGLLRCNMVSNSSSSVIELENPNTAIYNSKIVPRFYYGDASKNGDNGYWLLPNPNLPNADVHWISAPFKLDIMGQSYIYMEIDGQNCLDETVPYNISAFTLTTNQTNGIVNSAFAKIPIISTPVSQWYDNEYIPYKYYYPPAERLRKLHIRFRYHNGLLVNFGNFNFTFTIEFTLQTPQILRNSNTIGANSSFPNW